jgi:hypothetical protein
MGAASGSQIVEKLGRRLDAGDEQMIPRSGAGDIEQVALGVVDFLQVGVIAHGFDALLQRDDLVVAGHHHQRAERRACALR